MMKYIYPAFMVLLLMGNIAKAQTKGDNQWGIGYGYNISNVNIGTDIKGDTRGGINLVLSMDHYLSPRWSIKGRLQYDMKGWGSGSVAGTQETDIKLDHRLDYLTVPVLANYHFGPTKALYTHIGPYAAVLLSGKKIDNGIAVKPDVNNADMGLLWGFGGQISVKNNLKLFAEFNALGSFVGTKRSADGNKYHNGLTGFTIGFNF